MYWKEFVISSEQNDQSGSERARRMEKQNRPTDAEFLPDELLYLRCANSSLDPANTRRLFPDQIRFYPDQSVNRGKYSEPEDVLHPNYLDFGIARFQVQHVQLELSSGGEINYQWTIEHKPEENNYAHSEIWTYKDKQHITDSKLPTGIKKQFRQMLSERAEVIKQPQV